MENIEIKDKLSLSWITALLDDRRQKINRVYIVNNQIGVLVLRTQWNSPEVCRGTDIVHDVCQRRTGEHGQPADINVRRRHQALTNTHAHTHSHARTHARTHKQTRMHARTHAGTHARTHTRTHAHTHTHTHTQTYIGSRCLGN